MKMEGKHQKWWHNGESSLKYCNILYCNPFRQRNILLNGENPVKPHETSWIWALDSSSHWGTTAGRGSNSLFLLRAFAGETQLLGVRSHQATRH